MNYSFFSSVGCCFFPFLSMCNMFSCHLFYYFFLFCSFFFSLLESVFSFESSLHCRHFASIRHESPIIYILIFVVLLRVNAALFYLSLSTVCVCVWMQSLSNDSFYNFIFITVVSFIFRVLLLLFLLLLLSVVFMLDILIACLFC